MEFDTSFREDFPFLSALFPENNPLTTLLKPVDDQNHHHPPSSFSFHNFLVSNDDEHPNNYYSSSYNSSTTTTTTTTTAVNSSYNNTNGSLTNHHHHLDELISSNIEGSSSGSPFLALSPACTNRLDGESQPTDHLITTNYITPVTQGGGMEDEAANFLHRTCSWTNYFSSHHDDEKMMISSLFPVSQPVVLSDYQTDHDQTINYKQQQQQLVDEDDQVPCLAAAAHAGGQDVISTANHDDDNNQRINVSSKRIAVIKKGNRKWNSKVDIIKGQWTPQEDRMLVQLVSRYGTKRWSHIARMLTGRVGKQCRERWHNHLRPDIKKDSWSEDEDKILIEAHKAIGNRWAEIARRLPGRTENTIKNHWNATKRRQFSRRNTVKCHNNNNNNNKDHPAADQDATSNTTTPSLLQTYINSLVSTLSPSSNQNNMMMTMMMNHQDDQMTMMLNMNCGISDDDHDHHQLPQAAVGISSSSAVPATNIWNNNNSNGDAFHFSSAFDHHHHHAAAASNNNINAVLYNYGYPFDNHQMMINPSWNSNGGVEVPSLEIMQGNSTAADYDNQGIMIKKELDLMEMISQGNV